VAEHRHRKRCVNLRLAEELSHGSVRWALLTNGRLWRLYFQGAGSKAEQFLEADLPAMLEPGGEVALATFILLFRRDSFVPDADDRTFFQSALDRALEWREQVTADLANVVFDDVFPALLAGLSQADMAARSTDVAWPEAIRDSALILLYRLLFCSTLRTVTCCRCRTTGIDPSRSRRCGTRWRRRSNMNARSPRRRRRSGADCRGCSARSQVARTTWDCRPTTAACSSHSTRRY
jgi:hypothetical protein